LRRAYDSAKRESITLGKKSEDLYAGRSGGKKEKWQDKNAMKTTKAHWGKKGIEAVIMGYKAWSPSIASTAYNKETVQRQKGNKKVRQVCL